MYFILKCHTCTNVCMCMTFSETKDFRYRYMHMLFAKCGLEQSKDIVLHKSRTHMFHRQSKDFPSASPMYYFLCDMSTLIERWHIVRLLSNGRKPPLTILMLWLTWELLCIKSTCTCTCMYRNALLLIMVGCIAKLWLNALTFELQLYLYCEQ